MPEENLRKRARVLVTLPSGDQMYVPVITEIDFVDPVGDPSALATKWAPGQEWDYSVDNTSDSSRTVHVDEVNPIIVDANGVPTTDPPTSDTSQILYVERIDTWPVVDPVGRGQEHDYAPDNKTGAGPTDSSGNTVLPHFSAHQKTHIYRYYQDPNNPDDNGVWIDSELIDEINFVDNVNRGQESDFTLQNSTNADFQGGDLSGQADPNDPDITIDGSTGEGVQDTPVRLDPFQNIVNFSSSQPIFSIAVYGVMPDHSLNSAILDALTLSDVPTETDTGVSIQDPPPDGQIPGGTNAVTQYLTGLPLEFISSGSVSGFNQSGVPPVSGSLSVDFSAWKWCIPVGPLSTPPIVSGPPLIVGGKPIPGYLATLTATYSVVLASIVGGSPQLYDFFFPGPVGGIPPTSNWISCECSWTDRDLAGRNAPATIAGNITLTVSSSTFTFNGQNYQAVGLDGRVNTTGSNAINVYCIPV